MKKKEKKDTVLGTDNFLLKKADISWKEEKHNCIAPIKENQEERYDEALQKQLWTIWDLDLQGIFAMKRCENAAGPVEQKMGFTAFKFLQTDVFFLPPKKLVSLPFPAELLYSVANCQTNYFIIVFRHHCVVSMT